jgi:hypothetical protein
MLKMIDRLAAGRLGTQEIVLILAVAADDYVVRVAKLHHSLGHHQLCSGAYNYGDGSWFRQVADDVPQTHFQSKLLPDRLE